MKGKLYTTSAFSDRDGEISEKREKPVALNKIGAHNEDVISTLVGNLLGDGWGESRSGSSRFHIHMSTKNMEYAAFLHKFFSDRQYCSTNPLKREKQIGKGGSVYYSLRFRTYSYRSLNWLQQLFYPEGLSKRVPPNIVSLLTPRALAIWFMDDGAASGAGCRIAAHSFPREDVELLRDALQERYGFHCTIQRQGKCWTIYFIKGEKILFCELIKPFMVPSMYYKLNLKEHLLRCATASIDAVTNYSLHPFPSNLHREGELIGGVSNIDENGQPF